MEQSIPQGLEKLRKKVICDFRREKARGLKPIAFATFFVGLKPMVPPKNKDDAGCK
jgi:hypothetical protein